MNLRDVMTWDVTIWDTNLLESKMSERHDAELQAASITSSTGYTVSQKKLDPFSHEHNFAK